MRRLIIAVSLLAIAGFVLVAGHSRPSQVAHAHAPTTTLVRVADPPPSAPLAQAPAPPPFTFAVLSDLHLAATGSDRPPPAARRAIAAVLAAHPRFVVITGDFTNGKQHEHAGHTRFRSHAWNAIRALLQPLRDAGIPILPIAGNHDAYLAAQRAEYAAAFADLATWAAPLAVNASPLAPFAYSVDVDGVHLALAHIVDQSVRPDVARWLAGDLAAARGARLRIVFGHVPYATVIGEPNPVFTRQLGALLEHGRADLYVAGHEHLDWDEDVRLPDGGTLREILVGTATGVYDFGPSLASKRRAHCVRTGPALHCRMPNGATPFELRRNYIHHWMEAQRATFALLTVDGTTVTSRIVAVDKKGRTAPFGAR